MYVCMYVYFFIFLGPNSSTSLPWRSNPSPNTADAAAPAITPTTVRNALPYGNKTPVADILDQTFTNGKTTTSKVGVLLHNICYFYILYFYVIIGFQDNFSSKLVFRKKIELKVKFAQYYLSVSM